MWGRAGKPATELSDGDEEDDAGVWHTVQQRQSRGRPLLYAACTGITSIRNAYSCLTGVVSHEHMGNINSTSNGFVGQWYVDDITTDALGHHNYATGYVAWNPTAHPVGLYGHGEHEGYDDADGVASIVKTTSRRAKKKCFCV